MFNNRVIAIIKRELREKLSSKSFIIMTILMPLLIVAMGAIPTLIMQMGSGTTNLQIISEEQSLGEAFQKELGNYEFVKDGSYKIEYFTMSKEEYKKHLETVKPKILDESINALIYIPVSSHKDKVIEYYAKTPNISISEKLNRPFNKILVNSYFNNKLTEEELAFAGKGVDFKGFTVSEGAGVKEESYGNLVLSYIVTILLFMGLMQIGSMTMQSVIEEKSNRIVEIILSSMKPQELLGGKIIGASITGLAQMIIWLSPVVLLASGTLFALPKDFSVTLSTFQLGYILLNFLFGLVIFTGLFAMVGSIFDSPQDAQQGVFPVMLLLLIPYMISFTLIQNPTSSLGVITSMLPITNIIIMPVRFTIIEVPLWNLAIPIIVNIITIYFVIWFAGKIYRVGILKTGKKPKWSEVIKWLKEKN